MLLLVFLFAGLIIGMFRRGGLSGLVRIRGLWLIIVSVAAERSLVYLPRFAPQLFPVWTPALQVVRFLPLLLFALLNVKDWRMCLAGVGIALNFAVIAANGWRMPVSWDAASVPGLAGYVGQVQSGGMPAYALMSGYAGASLWFFSDVIPLNFIPSFPMGYMSVGDALLSVGLMLAVQHSMAKYSIGKHARGSLAKHLYGKADKPDAAKKAPRQETAAAQPAREPEPAGPSPEPEPAPEPSVTAVLPEEPQPPASSPRPASPPAPWEPEPLYAEPGPEPEYPPASGEGRGRYAEPESLSPRLAAVAGLVPRGAVAADVGCDHGKLAVWLAANGAPFVVATDVSAKSLAKTRKLVAGLGLQSAVRMRTGDGLKKLRPGETDVIVIAGLGGPTICSILDNGCNVAEAAARLVLQPMNRVGDVRRWLADNGFRVVAEELAEDDGRIYQALAAEPGADGRPPMSLFDLEVGHLLVDNRHPLLPKLLEFKIATIDKILGELAGNNTARADARRSELIELKERCAEVLES